MFVAYANLHILPDLTLCCWQVVNFWLTYQQKVETDPVPTKALTSFLGFVIGDFLAQKIEGREYDALRYCYQPHLAY